MLIIIDSSQLSKDFISKTTFGQSFDAIRVFYNLQSATKDTPYGQLACRIISRRHFELAMNKISKCSNYDAKPMLTPARLAKDNGIAGLYYKDES